MHKVYYINIYSFSELFTDYELYYYIYSYTAFTHHGLCFAIIYLSLVKLKYVWDMYLFSNVINSLNNVLNFWAERL